jgi:NADPH:quinone reductase-like Zn-dependent oxidoreductase
MATHAVVDRRRSIELPADVDVERIAAGMNPAMSAWVALRRRVPFQAGQTVLVLGATGSAGQMAVQIARRFGAGRVVAAGRDPQRLAALASGGADTAVSLAGEPGDVAAALADAAADVDVVLDYLWGAPTSEAIMAILRARGDRSRALSWVQIGSMAGPTIELPSIALRSANLHLLGNGQGAVSTSTYLEELPALAAAIDRHDIDVTAHPTRLADIETTWTAAEPPGTRTVIVM